MTNRLYAPPPPRRKLPRACGSFSRRSMPVVNRRARLMVLVLPLCPCAACPAAPTASHGRVEVLRDTWGIPPRLRRRRRRRHVRPRLRVRRGPRLPDDLRVAHHPGPAGRGGRRTTVGGPAARDGAGQRGRHRRCGGDGTSRRSTLKHRPGSVVTPMPAWPRTRSRSLTRRWAAPGRPRRRSRRRSGPVVAARPRPRPHGHDGVVEGRRTSSSAAVGRGGRADHIRATAAGLRSRSGEPVRPATTTSA